MPSTEHSIEEIAGRQMKALEFLLASDSLKENFKRQEEWKARQAERDAEKANKHVVVNASGAEKAKPQYSAHLDPGVAAMQQEEEGSGDAPAAGQKRPREEADE